MSTITSLNAWRLALYGPCNETHPGGVGPDNQHKSHYHRPNGFAHHMEEWTNEFPTSFCNNSVKSERKFRNSDTNWEDVNYREYRTVNHYYKSWNIEGMAIEDNLSWRYITYQVAKNLNSFFSWRKTTRCK